MFIKFLESIFRRSTAVRTPKYWLNELHANEENPIGLTAENMDRALRGKAPLLEPPLLEAPVALRAQPTSYYEEVGLDGLTQQQRDVIANSKANAAWRKNNIDPRFEGKAVVQQTVSRGFIAFQSDPVPPQQYNDQLDEADAKYGQMQSALTTLFDRLNVRQSDSFSNAVYVQCIVPKDEYALIAELIGRPTSLPKLPEPQYR